MSSPEPLPPASIHSIPAAGQIIENGGKTYETIREGAAYILVPPNTQVLVDPQAKAKKAVSAPAVKPQSVFYNPIQQFNRDLSVLAIKAFGEDFLERKRARGAKHKSREKSKRSKKRKIGDSGADDESGGAKLRKLEGDTLVETDFSAKEDAGPKARAAEDGAISADAIQTDRPGTEVDAPLEQHKDQHSVENGQHQCQPPKLRFRILDALSATGLRALRYAKEIPLVTSVVANDMNPNAIKSMSLNVEHNGLKDKITPNLGDAIGHMYNVAYPPWGSHGPNHLSQKYDVVDLDPYGTAVPFLDAALQSLNDGGLLCVTCTDSGVFASTGYCEKTYALYGGMPVKGVHNHEGGLRLILHSIATAAAKHGLAIEPLLSLNIDFYARVFVRVRKSALDVKFLAGKSMIVYGCDAGCGAWSTQMIGRNVRQANNPDNIWYKHTIAQAPGTDRLCEHCKSKTHIAGPMWGGPIHNPAFIEKILADVEHVDQDIYQTTARIEGMLSTALEELNVNDDLAKSAAAASSAAPKKQPSDPSDDARGLIPKVPVEAIDLHPFFVHPSSLAKVLHCVAPGDAPIRGALRHAGYRAVRSHCQPGSIKTDAPWSAIWEIMREWVRLRQPIKEGALKENSPGWHIMQAARPIPDTPAPPAPSGPADDATPLNGTTDDTTPDIITDPAPPAKTPASLQASTPPTTAPADPPRIKVVFDELLGKDKPGKKRLVRYQQNPRENWGPMTRAKGSG